MTETLKLEERILTGIDLGESHFREFKSALQRNTEGKVEPRPVKEICRNIGEVLVSFANADGGELFVGVEDDSTISGVPHKDELLDAMKLAYSTYVHADSPIPTPSIKLFEVKGNKILYFQVSKSTGSVHLTSDGRCLQRFDRENRIVPPERIQQDRQEILSREYDRNFIPSATLKDLDIDLIDGIAQQLAPGYSPEKLLQFLDLAQFGPEGLILRRAALLLFARDVIKWHPRCSIRILRVTGSSIGTGKDYNVSEDDMINGNIVSLLENSWDALRPHLARTKFQANALFRESIIYPEDACREALINAVAHRDYSIEGKPIEILIYDDRMEVKSPGRLLSSILIKDLKELKGAHQSRNVFIARVLRELGYMREMGEGIRRIYSSVRSFELVDPEIHADQASFMVTLFHKSIFSPKDVQWLNGFTDFHLTKDEQRVVLLGRDGRLLSTNDIIQVVEIIDTEEFRALYERLNRKGIIYNAKPTTRGGKRQVPRFQIRPPQEAQQYLAELQNALLEIGQIEKFDMPIAKKLRDRISSNSPYNREPVFSLRALGYVSEMFTPLPRTAAIWTKTSLSKYQSSSEPDRLKGTVTYLVEGRGFGFAKSTDGESFFIHASEFNDKSDWNKISIGSVLGFQAGERKSFGKERSAKLIRILE
ncbi:MAG: ATP-binding protein [Anaerolineales bacterium]|nr:ATP-binding protein [Anaerolineales bacterium]